MNFEDELKRRMEVARKSGWKEDEIQRSALIERGLQRQREAQKAAQAAKSKGAGRAGGLKGFALDVLPFGRVAEKAFNPNAGKISAGEVGMEALLSLAPFGLGRAAKAFKGARAAKAAVSATKPVARTVQETRLPQRIAQAFVKPQAEPGRMSRALMAKSNIAPASTLRSAAEQRAVIDLTRTMPSMRGSATRKFQNVRPEINRLADEVDQLFAGVKTRMPQRNFQRGINQVRKEIIDPLEKKRFDIEYSRVVQKAFNGKLPSQLAPTEVNTLRRAVNGQMTGIYNKLRAGTSLTDKDNAFLRLKETLDEQLTKLAPEGIRGQVKQLNRNMNTLIKAEPEFKKASETGGGLGPLGNLFGVGPKVNQGIQAVSDYTGRTLAQAGRVGRAPVGRNLLQQGAVRVGADAFGMRPAGAPAEQLPATPQVAFPDASTPEEMILNELLGAGTTDFSALADQVYGPGSQVSMQNAQQGFQQGPETGGGLGLQYSSTQLLNAAIQAGLAGDSKTSDQYIQLAGLANEMEQQAVKASGKVGSGGLNVSKVTSQQLGLAQVGLSSLQQLKGLIQDDPNAVARSAVPGGSLPVVGGYIRNAAGVGPYDALGYNIADTLIRLRTGAQANESEIRGYANKIMPRAGDSSETVALKLQQLEDSFNTIVNLAYNSGAQSDFPDQLAEMFGGGGSYQSQYGYGY